MHKSEAPLPWCLLHTVERIRGNIYFEDPSKEFIAFDYRLIERLKQILKDMFSYIYKIINGVHYLNACYLETDVYKRQHKT